MNLSKRKRIQYMEWAVGGAKIFSTCSRRQYMAIVLSPDGRVVGTGYNGGPAGFVHCKDGGCPRALDQSVQHGKDYNSCIAVHAEANALMHSDRTDRLGGTLVINGPPCGECAKLITGSGLKRVVYMADPAYTEWGKVRMLLLKAGIVMIEVERDLVAGAGLGGLPCGDVGSGSEQDMGVAVFIDKSKSLGNNDPSRTALGVNAPVPRYDPRLLAQRQD